MAFTHALTSMVLCHSLIEYRAQLQTEPTMRRQYGIACHLRTHLAIAQDEVREDGEHGFAPRTLDTPDGDPTETDSEIMRVAGQAAISMTGRFVFQLKAKGHDEGEDTFEKRLAIPKQLKDVASFRKSTVMVRFSRVRRSVVRMGHPQIRWSVLLMTQHRGMLAELQGDRAGGGVLPLKAMKCGLVCKRLAPLVTIAGVSSAGSGCGLAPRTRPGYFFYVIQGLRGPEAPHTPATCPARTMTAQAGWQMWRVCRGCPCVCMLTLGLCCRLPYNPSEPPLGAGMRRPRGIARCTRP
jgi:hypothetical protein